MERAISADGTSISYHRSGAGPPLVLIPGTGAANPRAWTDVIPLFEERMSICAVDRRGHGASSDGPIYSIEREFEDVAAVVDSTGEPAYVLGHSFGGLCSLEASLLTPNIRKLILYEPSIPLPGISPDPGGLVERLEEMLERGDRENVLSTYYLELAGLSPADVEMMRSSPAWPERLATAHTLTRESRAFERYEFDAAQFRDMHTPTLLIAGSDSPPVVQEVSRMVETALPDCRTVVLPGQEHIAMYTAPDLFAREVLAFLIGSD